MLVETEIHSFSTKGDALHLETEALFRSGFKVKLDFTGSAHDALPGKLIDRAGPEQTGHSTVIQRISRSGGYLAVCRYFSFRNGENDTPESGIANFIRTRTAFQSTAIFATLAVQFQWSTPLLPRILHHLRRSL